MSQQSAHVRPRAIRGPTTTVLWVLCALGCVLLITTNHSLAWERLYLVDAIVAGAGACTRMAILEQRKTREHVAQMYEDSLIATEAVAEQVVEEVLGRLADEPGRIPSKSPLALVNNTPANGIAVLSTQTWRAGGH